MRGMRVPVAAVLLLAALSALPYQGTDADTASTILNRPTATDSQPILNKLYLMIHTAELRNSTELSNSNYTSSIYGFSFYTMFRLQRKNGQMRAKTGSGIYAAATTEIEALVGFTAHCKVDALHDKLVSWVRRKNEKDRMELLYTDTQQYTADVRYSSRFIPPDIWRLEVKEVRPSDAAHYECQMPTHPPRTARLTLRVPG